MSLHTLSPVKSVAELPLSHSTATKTAFSETHQQNVPHSGELPQTVSCILVALKLPRHFSCIYLHHHHTEHRTEVCACSI